MKRKGQLISLGISEGFTTSLSTMDKNNPEIFYFNAKKWLIGFEGNITSLTLHHIRHQIEKRIKEIVKEYNLLKNYLCIVDASLGPSSRNKRCLTIDVFLRQNKNKIKPLNLFLESFQNFFLPIEKKIACYLS